VTPLKALKYYAAVEEMAGREETVGSKNADRGRREKSQ